MGDVLMVATCKFFEDEMGRKICSIEDENVAVEIVLKKDYSDVEEKFRDMHILQDIKKALDGVSDTKEFKELVDSYGFLSPDHISE